MQNKAFTDFYNRNFEYVYSYIFPRTARDPQGAADIVQETFIAVFKSMNSFKGLSSEKTWILSIARNKLHDWYRRQFRSREKLSFVDEEACNEKLEKLESDDNVEECVLNNEVRKQVAAALAEINPDYRLVLVMKYLDGATVKEIAAVTGRTAKAVDGMLQRAKAAFTGVYQKLHQEDIKNG